MAIEVTEEMRRAVYTADCEAQGHIMDISNAVGVTRAHGVAGTYAPDVLGPDDETLPHLSCRRCGRVWLVIDESGVDYPDAVSKLTAKVRDPEMVKPRKRDRAVLDPDHYDPPPADLLGAPPAPIKKK